MSTCIDPVNLSFLSPIGFQFQLRRAPHVQFFLQEVNLPGLSLPPAQIGSPFVTIPIRGDHLQYEPLNLTFRVNENMSNWFEIYNWLTEISAPRSFDEYNPEGQEPDATLLVLNSDSKPNIQISFYNIVPISLGQILFDSTATDMEYVSCQAEFVYTTYKATIL